jgi:hypothetical protein
MSQSALLSLFLRICSPFSKVINRINWRFGRPFHCTHKKTGQMREKIKPGMVILTHKKYELTSMFIPGYWTHSALVTSPGLVIEATAKGVGMNTLDAFFSTVDDFIVLSPRFCCPETMKKAGERASTLVGFPYCFDFRNSPEMFYCSGLICWVYSQTLIERDQPHKIPFVMRDYLSGSIIRPMDLYQHRDAWQVVGSFKESNLCSTEINISLN